ncbi:UDP-glucose 4-epimerase GalE [Exiguobacterium sp. 17-1]|uniref:UDP-glucose 4-epimerase GalE n=1 Tax=Exiguobacterium sp. 17-1 TaxID=2931981 RepID=UPI001FFF4B25|nr:UDP-glucose 4-epimerase GalE [Exiguobacterium sp. 17-1]MCK2156183.1 UDP-glucose 4-epimerase GalE [Exiguobacterium sp. 17-1]
MEEILITGGAGYIGSHTTYRAIESGMKVIVVDNLITGHKEALHPYVKFYEGDIKDSSLLNRIFSENKISHVIHFAASSLVGESNNNPLKYYSDNLYGTQILLECMAKNKIKNIVFSSSAAIYGEQLIMPIKEEAAQVPSSPYGETKLAVEKLLYWCEKAYGIKYVTLRYFNAAGALENGLIGEDHEPESHLIPLVLNVANDNKEYISVFGNDYDTHDGTCIRDYIHVQDLAEAHIKSIFYLNELTNKSDAFNLGTNKGYSVLEVINAVQKITGRSIPVKYLSRRDGDPAKLVASSEKAKQYLNWIPKNSGLERIIKDAWSWHFKNPKGY